MMQNYIKKQIVLLKKWIRVYMKGNSESDLYYSENFEEQGKSLKKT